LIALAQTSQWARGSRAVFFDTPNQAARQRVGQNKRRFTVVQAPAAVAEDEAGAAGRAQRQVLADFLWAFRAASSASSFFACLSARESFLSRPLWLPSGSFRLGAFGALGALGALVSFSLAAEGLGNWIELGASGS
jgi:hypothetical protein